MKTKAKVVAGAMAQLVKRLRCRHQVLGLSPSPHINKKAQMGMAFKKPHLKHVLGRWWGWRRSKLGEPRPGWHLLWVCRGGPSSL